MSSSALPDETNAEIPPAVPSRLCDKCIVLSFSDALIGDPKGGLLEPQGGMTMDLEYGQKDTLPDLPILRASAAAGCAFCAVLRDATFRLRLNGPADIEYELKYAWAVNEIEFDWDVEDIHKNNVGLCLLLAKVCVRFKHDRGRSDTVHEVVFTIDSEDNNLKSWLRLLHSPSAHALSKSNVEEVRKALSYCENTCNCNPLQTHGYRPTRLLDLREWDKYRCIKLVESASFSVTSAVRYAALSYCWGPAEDAARQLKTTDETISTHMDLIPEELLTPVIRDAVLTTRAFSLDYLWVDALCIIQGNGEDWLIESAQMDSVYINAYCTICTLASSTCRDGFLERPSPIVVAFESRIQQGAVGHFNLRHLPRSGHDLAYKDIYHDPFDLELEAAAWQSRGWTFQEQYLSARKVYFGHSRIFYSCPQKEWTEPSVWGSPSDLTLANLVQEFESKKDLESVRAQWKELLELYTGRQLTVQSDVLPAIAGLAKQVARVTGDKYFAGLWHTDLMRQLLWQSLCPHHLNLSEFLKSLAPSEQGSHKLACPTWSCLWQTGSSCTGLHGGVNCLGRDLPMRYEAEILETCAQPGNPELNPWGQLESAHVQIKAKQIIISNRPWTKIDRERQFYEVGMGTSSHSKVVICTMDRPLESLQDLHSYEIVMILLASTHGSHDACRDWVPKGGRSDEDQGAKADGFTNDSSDEPMDSKNMAFERIQLHDNKSCPHPQYMPRKPTVDQEKVQDIRDRLFDDVGMQDAGLAIRGTTTIHAKQDSDGEDSEEVSGEDGTEESELTARGLLLYRLSDMQYVRVGSFASTPRQGGLAVFENCQTEVFTII